MWLYGHVLTQGYYYANLWFGTPGRRFAVIVDTGSTVTYVPCASCSECGSHHQDLPFDPQQSSTYQFVPCSSDQCPYHDCQDNSDECSYDRHYAENSSSSGLIVSDVVTFGNASTLPPARILFGCELAETGDIYTQKADGIMGMGRGELGIVSQLSVGAGKVMDEQFSLCYGGSEGGGGAMIMGAIQPPAGMKFTKMDMRSGGTYYNVILNAITVAGKPLDLDMSVFRSGYGVVMDSGTTFSYLPRKAFEAFKAAVDASVKGVQSVPGPDSVYQDVCYGGASHKIEELSNYFPTVSLTFDGDLVYELTPENYLFRHVKVPGSYCLGLFKNNDRGTLIGGIIMRNTLVTYDRVNSRIGMLKTNCRNLYQELQQIYTEQGANPSPLPEYLLSEPPPLPDSAHQGAGRGGDGGSGGAEEGEGGAGGEEGGGAGGEDEDADAGAGAGTGGGGGGGESSSAGVPAAPSVASSCDGCAGSIVADLLVGLPLLRFAPLVNPFVHDLSRELGLLEAQVTVVSFHEGQQQGGAAGGADGSAEGGGEAATGVESTRVNVTILPSPPDIVLAKDTVQRVVNVLQSPMAIRDVFGSVTVLRVQVVLSAPDTSSARVDEVDEEEGLASNIDGKGNDAGNGGMEGDGEGEKGVKVGVFGSGKVQGGSGEEASMLNGGEHGEDEGDGEEEGEKTWPHIVPSTSGYALWNVCGIYVPSPRALLPPSFPPGRKEISGSADILRQAGLEGPYQVLCERALAPSAVESGCLARIPGEVDIRQGPRMELAEVLDSIGRPADEGAGGMGGAGGAGGAGEGLALLQPLAVDMLLRAFSFSDKAAVALPDTERGKATVSSNWRGANGSRGAGGKERERERERDSSKHRSKDKSRDGERRHKEKDREKKEKDKKDKEKKERERRERKEREEAERREKEKAEGVRVKGDERERKEREERERREREERERKEREEREGKEKEERERKVREEKEKERAKEREREKEKERERERERCRQQEQQEEGKAPCHVCDMKNLSSTLVVVGSIITPRPSLSPLVHHSHPSSITLTPRPSLSPLVHHSHPSSITLTPRPSLSPLVHHSHPSSITLTPRPSLSPLVHHSHPSSITLTPRPSLSPLVHHSHPSSITLTPRPSLSPLVHHSHPSSITLTPRPSLSPLVHHSHPSSITLTPRPSLSPLVHHSHPSSITLTPRPSLSPLVHHSHPSSITLTPRPSLSPLVHHSHPSSITLTPRPSLSPLVHHSHPLVHSLSPLVHHSHPSSITLTPRPSLSPLVHHSHPSSITLTPRPSLSPLVHHSHPSSITLTPRPSLSPLVHHSHPSSITLTPRPSLSPLVHHSHPSSITLTPRPSLSPLVHHSHPSSITLTPRPSLSPLVHHSHPSSITLTPRPSLSPLVHHSHPSSITLTPRPSLSPLVHHSHPSSITLTPRPSLSPLVHHSHPSSITLTPRPSLSPLVHHSHPSSITLTHRSHSQASNHPIPSISDECVCACDFVPIGSKSCACRVSHSLCCIACSHFPLGLLPGTSPLILLPPPSFPVPPNRPSFCRPPFAPLGPLSSVPPRPPPPCLTTFICSHVYAQKRKRDGEPEKPSSDKKHKKKKDKHSSGGGKEAAPVAAVQENGT
ncbi:unnamed protein product [Closterium sp. NIES-64]|nr:unnamed protein product [Closterium sp. NIES-64]